MPNPESSPRSTPAPPPSVLPEYRTEVVGVRSFELSPVDTWDSASKNDSWKEKPGTEFVIPPTKPLSNFPEQTQLAFKLLNEHVGHAEEPDRTRLVAALETLRRELKAAYGPSRDLACDLRVSAAYQDGFAEGLRKGRQREGYGLEREL